MSTHGPNPAQPEPEPPLESDPWIYRIAVTALGLALLLTTAGVFVLFLLQKNANTFDPGGLVAIGTAAVGALAGLLGGPISMPKTRKSTSSTSTAALIPTLVPANLAPTQNVSAPTQPAATVTTPPTTPTASTTATTTTGAASTSTKSTTATFPTDLGPASAGPRQKGS